MTKVNVSRLFEKALVAGSKAAEELAEFIDWANDLADNTIRILRNGISIVDNFDATFTTVTVQSGMPATFSTAKRPILVIVASQSPTQYPITSFVWEQTTQNQIKVTAVFGNAIPANQKVTLNLWVQFS